MNPNQQYVNEEHEDDRYLEDRDSRGRVWQALLDMQDYRRNKDKNKEPEDVEPFRPLTVLDVRRNDESTCNKFLSICSRKPEDNLWICNFCGTDITAHSWQSFDTYENGAVLPRTEPSECTLWILIDKMAQDFFPGSNMILDLRKTHRHTATYQVLVFFEMGFAELGTLDDVMSTADIKLKVGEPDQDDEQAYRYIGRNLRGSRREEDFTIGRHSLEISEQFVMLKSWLARCTHTGEGPLPDQYDLGTDRDDEVPESEHTMCHERSGPKPIAAKRVLDLTSVHDGYVRLVETTGLKEPYAALSHCWGDPSRHPLRTTKATLDKHMASIPIRDLTPSFVDAMAVCKSIDIWYIWIDCLCIVQDDGDEWTQEAEKMAAIYSDSFLTIAATRATNSWHGFLRYFPEDLIIYEVEAEAPWDVSQPKRILNATFQIDHSASKFGGKPLDTRAWCLQEWYLPKRLVEFQRNNIRFLCYGRTRDRFNSVLDNAARMRGLLRFGHRDANFFCTQWESLREDFSYREISRLSDRLPALAGLAQTFETILMGVDKHRYLAGLWSTRIAEDLSWTVHGYNADAGTMKGLPSWSWASVGIATGYIYHKASKTFVDFIDAHCTGYAKPKETYPSLTIRAFSKTMYMRVDSQTAGYDGRPHISFWEKPYTAMTTKTAEIEKWHHLLRQAERRKTAGCFVSDVSFAPTAHQHLENERQNTLVYVPSVERETIDTDLCETCELRGYLTAVQLVLLSRTDACWLALVLAPVPKPPQELQGQTVYQRLGLMEVGKYDDPYVRTPDGYVTAWDTFWEVKKPETRKVITMI